MTKTSMSRKTAPLKKGKDGYYRPIYAQGGGAKIFWSFVSADKKEAEKIIPQGKDKAVGYFDSNDNFAAILRTTIRHFRVFFARF